MSFGMKNFPGIFQCLSNKVLAGLDVCEAYIDDFLICSSFQEEHLQTVWVFFTRLSNGKLTVNLCKSEFGCMQATYRGKSVDSNDEDIVKFWWAQNERQSMCVLGMADYYWKFCLHFSSVAEPLIRLPGKKVKFEWCAISNQAFQDLKLM